MHLSNILNRPDHLVLHLPPSSSAPLSAPSFSSSSSCSSRRTAPLSVRDLLCHTPPPPPPHLSDPCLPSPDRCSQPPFVRPASPVATRSFCSSLSDTVALHALDPHAAPHSHSQAQAHTQYQYHYHYSNQSVATKCPASSPSSCSTAVLPTSTPQPLSTQQQQQQPSHLVLPPTAPLATSVSDGMSRWLSPKSERLSNASQQQPQHPTHQQGTVAVQHGGASSAAGLNTTMAPQHSATTALASYDETDIHGNNNSNSNTSAIRGPWGTAEDQLLHMLVRQHGGRHWSAVAAQLPGRTGKQARERWLNQLRPGVRKKGWRAVDDRVILAAHARVGNRWSGIAPLLAGRTDNAVKNRFNSTLRRAVRQCVAAKCIRHIAGDAVDKGAYKLSEREIDRVVQWVHRKAGSGQAAQQQEHKMEVQ